MKKIGIYVEPALPPNVEKLLLNIGEMLHDKFKLDMIGRFTPTDDLLKFYQHKVYTGEEGAEGFQRIKQGYINCREYCLRGDPDALIQLIMYPIYAPIVSWVGRDLSVPTAVRIPEDTFNEYKVRKYDVLERSKILFMNNILGKLPLKLADRVIVLTEHLRKEAVNKGCDADKIVKLPQPVNTRKFSPLSKKEKGNIREELDLPLEKKIALTVGRLDKIKGLDLLARAIDRYKEKDIAFCMVGEGSYRERLRKKHPKKVIAPGRVPFEMVEKYYKASDLLIHPSMLEGLPNVVLEAQASGLPVLARQANYTPELGIPTFKDSKDLIELLNQEWEFVPLPPEFKLDKLKKRYIRFVEELTNIEK